MQFDLIMTTQFTFMAAFLAMMGGAYYFSLMKSAVPLEYQSSVATSAVYCFMAAVMYAYMNVKFGIGTDGLKNGHYPTILRYIDWIVTTPLIVLKFPQLLGSNDKSSAIATLIIIADFIMIIFGFIGETSINASHASGEFNLIGFAMFGVSMLAWMFILFILYSTVTEASADKLGPIQQGLNKLKLFILIGWAIYPLGYVITLFSNNPDLRIWRELIYNVADLFNKVGFGMVALYAVQQFVKEAKIRQALSDI
jgi:sensory rhodopsin